MDEENTKVENSNNQKESKNDENPKKDGFFKNVWMSITKIEKYPDMAARGVGKAISYLAKIVAILTIILCLGMLYQTHNLLKQGIDYLQNNFPDFSYKDGILDVSSDKVVQISAEDSVIGEVIVDTKTEDEAQINQYTTQVENAGGGIIVLKDRVIIKNASVAGIVSYQYKDTLESMGITELNKQDVINYANSSNSLEGKRLTPDELEHLIEDIKNGKNDESFLYAVVKMIKKKEHREDELEEAEVKVYGKNR